MSQFGYYLIYSIQQQQLHREMKTKILAGIPLFMQDVVEYSTQIDWVEKDREFYLDGVLYDVIAVKKESGKTLIYSLSDAKEKKLVDDFAKEIKAGKDDTNGGKKSKLSPGFQFPDFTAPAQGQVFLFENNAVKKYGDYTTAVVNLTKEITGPPPRA
jgi:hypothetical protein